MANFVIHQDVWKALDNFRLPETLGFGLVPAPVMYSATFENGVWSQGQLLPYGYCRAPAPYTLPSKPSRE